MLCKKHQYFVLYRGDDTDFPGNQELIVELNTERDLTGCSAHFSFQGFTQDFAEIPSDKKLRLVIPNSATGKFALGAADAKLWLTNGTKVRTVENRIHIVVTNRVDEAYDNDDPQAITVTISGGGGGATVVLDDTVTEKSPNGVKSSGIWSWVKSLLPHWLTSDYAEPATVASVAEKRDKSDLAVYSVTQTENTDWTWTSENKELEAALNAEGIKIKFHDDNIMWNAVADPSGWAFAPAPGTKSDLSVVMYFIKGPEWIDQYPATATRPRYMDETLGPAKPNQQLAAVATDDAAKPADGSLMKYDAANDRLVKATAGTDYATKTELSAAVSTNNPAFVSAVQNTPAPEPGQGEDPPWGTWGTVGAAIAGLVAGLKWLKDKVFDSAGNIQDQFATDLLGKKVANVKANTASLAAAYSETATYAVGDAVTHDGKLYKCAVAITTAEAWTPAHWTETTVATLWNNADTTSYGGQN